MPIDVEKAFETDEHGFLVSEGGVKRFWVGGGPNAPTHDAPIGSRFFRTNGLVYKQGGPGTSDWVVESPQSLHHHINLIQETGATWTVADSFTFQGTGVAGTPSSITVLAAHSSTTADLRIYDVTNGLVICTYTGIPTALTINNMGTLSNLPSGPAIWEIQFQETGNGRVDIHDLYINF